MNEPRADLSDSTPGVGVHTRRPQGQKPTDAAILRFDAIEAAMDLIHNTELTSALRYSGGETPAP
ncbi:hypothetical protein ACFLRH_00695 [Actinomycetota bacterium]